MDYSKIKRISQAKKVTIKSLAEKIGMTEHGLHASIRNNSLKIRDLEKIADVLNIPVVHCFNESDDDDKSLAAMKISSTKKLELAMNEFIESVYVERFLDLEEENKSLKKQVGINQNEIESFKSQIEQLKGMYEILKSESKTNKDGK